MGHWVSSSRVWGLRRGVGRARIACLQTVVASCLLWVLGGPAKTPFVERWLLTKHATSYSPCLHQLHAGSLSLHCPPYFYAF
jgi:hypothetical protein